MKYGYAVIKMEGVGEFWWNEYYEVPVVKKVRLFDKESDRDNSIKIEYDKLRRDGHYNGATISSFITKG